MFIKDKEEFSVSRSIIVHNFLTIIFSLDTLSQNNLMILKREKSASETLSCQHPPPHTHLIWFQNYMLLLNITLK